MRTTAGRSNAATRARLGVVSRTMFACLAIAVVVICFALEARADVVSGQVYGTDGRVAAKQAFRVLKGDAAVATFTTDESGYFSVFLDPGAYKVRPQGKDDAEGDISGYPQPARQDVRLKRR